MSEHFPLVPVILSGGSGTRLWPLSRGMYPKQFMDLGGDSLFTRTVRRIRPLPGMDAPDAGLLVVCNEEHRFFASGILREEDVQGHILLEPEGRNTAPAAACAALAALSFYGGDGVDPLLLLLPSDHQIDDVAAFAAAVEQGLPLAEEGRLVTFGVLPRGPETGFGYIVRGEPLDAAFAIERFVEKPGKAAAENLLAEGNCYWNGGMFLFRASVFLAELAAFAPEMLAACRAAWDARGVDGNFIRLGREAFAACPSDSIDYAVMEHTRLGCVLPLDAGWTDLGSWNAFYEAGERDSAGNVHVGDVVSLENTGTYLHSTHRLVAAVGVSNLAVLETADAVLVVDQARAGEVKQLVEHLKGAGREETQHHLRVFRPWGWYERLALGERFQVKRLMLNPGARLSLQSHTRRAEHWVVVQGQALVRVGDVEQTLREDESVYIPMHTLHRLENATDSPVEIIETQTGEYLGEDDITRYEDVYGRIPPA